MPLAKDSKEDSGDKRKSVKELSENFENLNAKQSNKNNQHILKPSETSPPLKKVALKRINSSDISNYFEKLVSNIKSFEERISALESIKLEPRLGALDYDVQILKLESCNETEEKGVYEEDEKITNAELNYKSDITTVENDGKDERITKSELNDGSHVTTVEKDEEDEIITKSELNDESNVTTIEMDGKDDRITNSESNDGSHVTTVEMDGKDDRITNSEIHDESDITAAEMDEINRKIETLERYIDELKNRIIELESFKTKLSIFRSGGYIWKIENFEEKKNEAESGGRVSITSDPFYTSEFGYKMCLKLYPAGDGVGSGTHLSVFFAIMKGDFDDVLSWPFKKKVILELLDQEGKEKHYTEVFKKSDGKSECYKRPKENMNVASGAPKFYEWSELKSSRFYKNETIYIKISII